ncbi:MAG: hypothetical protein H8E41_06885 [Desulfobulbaceae bacterium]|uniref:Uncharacterized protein n=1 Tax=Candidatus Desulfobia pelagia TaxID=2841692 RepID=A0A8J6TFF4_9BACT|nr:hypothetical protein [Candidatus Desulfobia pelagia]
MKESYNVGTMVFMSGVVGLVGGVVLLHPATMFIMNVHGTQHTLNWNAFAMAFSFEHILMTCFYALLGAVTGVVFGVLNARLVKTEKRMEILEGFLPVCSFCMKVKDDKGCWSQLEAYLSQYSDVQISRRICDDCKTTHFPEIAERKNGKNIE